MSHQEDLRRHRSSHRALFASFIFLAAPLRLLLFVYRFPFSSLLSVGYFLLMANTFRSTHVLMLLVMAWVKSARGSELTENDVTVDPPENLCVSDSGRLGYLDITWNPPASLMTMTMCNIQYQLEYLDTFKNTWAVLRTSGRSYSAEFDLTKEVRVRAYTLLNGLCTNNVLQRSENYTALIQKPASSGLTGTEAKDFECVYHNMEWVECSWTRSPQTPLDAQQNLYFWYKPLEQAAECPEYILSGGIRSSCRFTGNSLPEFSDIIFCVNGSSPEGPLKAKFTSLQIQNHLKPATTDKLHLQTSSDEQLELLWENPVERLPGYCLEWEVEHAQDKPDGTTMLGVIHTTQTTLKLLPTLSEDRNCYKVRSKLSKYCADKSLWSDWSHERCYPAVEEVAPKSKSDLLPVYVCIAAAFVLLLAVPLCVWASTKMNKSREEKKLKSLITNLVAKTFRGQNVCNDTMI
uniref:Interleukin 13 receptor, alpha 2 n=1 Tax=Nothobranchius kuhntae TaxID=321403 RepID=A0A1A8I107_NOTKU